MNNIHVSNNINTGTDLVFFFNRIFVFDLLQGIGDNSQGFANFVLFCLLTVKIRNKFRLCCGQLIPCCRYTPEKDPLFGSTNLFYGTVD